MIESTVLSHYHKKQQWMASHIDDAQFPTPESKRGLAFYQAAETSPSVEEVQHTESQDGFTFYAVDCHPLVVRYALTLAQKWPDDQQEVMVEYLSQLSLTDIPTPDGVNVALYVAMERGKPVATGMLFETQEEESSVEGIYDVFGITDAAQTAMMSHMKSVAKNGVILVE
ncbi:hypothetical protein LRP49_00880 [Enterovibrio sp. ZSDZ35]|uniref:Uncharacterized protein n=1 Tax=Enterovibrio qingdaonensis TaxID=2899818 RepID=A0ABT5QFH9_9GAMM|nr:hypothetical protein [Enterovibrio sp. ZSDZ35]MDD1779736.1 hypothetical protein [Enterovibrio sp. ZSDZ35]